MKSFRAKDRSDEPPAGGCNGERDFHGDRRSNGTHASTTDPEARLYRKGKGTEAKLSYISNALTENHHGLVIAAELGLGNGNHGTRSGPEDDCALFAGITAPHARRR
jgi:hypothetical protein